MAGNTITPGIWKKLVSLVRSRGGYADEAEDFVQEAYARLAEYSKKAEVENPEGFLVRTAQNLAMSAHRKDTVRTKAHADTAVLDLLSKKTVLQDEAMVARERLDSVQQAIDELPPRAREVFLAHRVDGKTYAEIAAELGISVSAVEKNMARAITHMTLKVQGFGRKG